jgi:hypothetical protein
MAIKTFTTGELLSSSDTNTYLANSGLVYVTSATIGTAVSSVAVANAFSATYDNYKIVAHGGIGNTFQAISMTLTGAATSYYQILASGNYIGSVAGTIAGYHAQTTAYTGFTIATAGTMTGGTITVYGYRKA